MRRFLIVILLGLLLVGCDQASAPVPPATQQASSRATAASTAPTASGAASTTPGAYPAPADAYPAPAAQQSPDAYPAPSAQPKGPQFTLNAPVHTADTQVTGTGPVGVPVKLVNIARSGDTLGEAKIGSDGTFKIDLSTKVTAGDRIALMLGDTAGTNLNRDDFISGPGYTDYPLIGVLFASTVVE